MNSQIKIVDNFLDRKDIQKITSNDLTWKLQTSNRGKGELTFLSSSKKGDEFYNTYF